MFRRVEINLRLPLVLPLVDILRAQGAMIEAQQKTELPQEAKRAQANMAEVQTLLSLFNHTFLKTGGIAVIEPECPALLRACSLLRLKIRDNLMSAISDETLETMSDPNLYLDGKHDGIACYLLLATLQESLLQNFDFPSPGQTLSEHVAKFFSSLARRVRTRKSSPMHACPPANNDAHSSKDLWQVVVLNDPVNLMNYVTAVFQSVLVLPKDAAQQRMREVHELKKSMVWEGPKDQAEAYLSALQAWHLEVVLQRAPA